MHPSADFVRVETLSFWHRANFQLHRRTLCGFRVCRSALAVAPCEFQRRPANPLRGSCVSRRSHCGAVRIFNVDCEPSRCFQRVPALARGASCKFDLNRRPSHCFPRAAMRPHGAFCELSSMSTAVSRALSRGASSELFSESATFSWFWAGGGGAWSILRLLVALGRWRLWCVEHP